MNLKSLLTKLNPFKEKKPQRPPPPSVEEIKEAVKALPKEMVEEVENYKSVFKGKNPMNNKLSRAQQMELMELIARFKGGTEINEYFYVNYKMTITDALIRQYKRTAKWQPVIQELRNKYLLSTDQVAGSHKRVRMERRDKIFEKAMKAEKFKEALIATKHQEEEMEGSGRGANLSITLNQYNELSDKELEEKRQEIIDRLQKKNVIEIKKET